MKRLRVLALEPYHGLSHAAFLEGYARHSRHEVEIWSLPPRKWKWRMRGSAYHFADLARRPGALAPDAVLASDFLNLCEWRALAPPRFGSAPSLLYFHENQVTYPLGELAPRDFHYGWINLSSALAADRILFNSSFHREEFIRAVTAVLARMPDHVPGGLPERIRERSGVFPVGIDFEPHRRALARRPAVREGPPVLLWNHRWEHDKGPDLLAGALIELHRGKVPFRAVICGQTSTRKPRASDGGGPLASAALELGDRVLHLGYIARREEYLDRVAGADIVVSTARHDFFGVAVVEAMFLGCLPVLPRALAYPEIVPAHLHPELLYEPGTLAEFLSGFLRSPPYHLQEEVAAAAGRFDWVHLAPELDRILEALAAQSRDAQEPER